jgi:membrane protein
MAEEPGAFRDEMPSVLHPRGRLAPPLGSDAPKWRRLVRAAYRLGHGLYLHDAFEAAPAMAFHIFLSLLPLLVFFGYLVGSLAEKKGVEAVLWPLLDTLPRETDVVVREEVKRLADASTLGPLSALGFLWIASGGMHGLMNALETVRGAPRRPFWKKRVLSIGVVIVSVLALTAISFGVVKWDDLAHPPATTAELQASPSSSPSADPAPVIAVPHVTTSPRFRRRLKLLRSEGERAFALGLGLAGSIAALAAFYWFSVAHPSRVKRRVIPGAVVAVVLWIVVSWAFGLYVRSLTDYALFYGSLAAVAVLMVWIWLVSLAVLVGAELNAQLEGLRD